jgi:hypothetical protein
MKNGDVFRWKFKDHAKYCERAGSTAYWCMDQQCVYWEGICLVDTYGSGLSGQYLSSHARYVTEEEADLEFVCNLDDVEVIHKSVVDEYDKVYNLSHQKGCYPYFAVDKGVGKSKKAILAKKEAEIQQAEDEIRYLQNRVKWLTEEIKEMTK